MPIQRCFLSCRVVASLAMASRWRAAVPHCFTAPYDWQGHRSKEFRALASECKGHLGDEMPTWMGKRPQALAC